MDMMYDVKKSISNKSGGEGGIRTSEGVSRRFYRPFRLTTPAPLHRPLFVPPGEGGKGRGVKRPSFGLRMSPRGESNPLTYRLQVGCAAIAPLGRIEVRDYTCYYM